MQSINQHISLIWSIADELRGSYRRSEYGEVILPFTVLRRLDCLLEPTKEAALGKLANLSPNIEAQVREEMLNKTSGYPFHNTSPYTFQTLLNEPDQIVANFNDLLHGFSSDVWELFIAYFNLPQQIVRLDHEKLLYLITQQFAKIDLHAAAVSDSEMGHIFEELVSRFYTQMNEIMGDYYSSLDLNRLMTTLLFQEDLEVVEKRAATYKLYDPACGTGGMFRVAEEHLKQVNPNAQLEIFGQDVNVEVLSICKSDRLLRGKDIKHIYLGNSFTHDALPEERFDYIISNPPMGLSWADIKRFIEDEHKQPGPNNRFDAGLPRLSDASLLFVQHMMSKFNGNDDTSRLAVVLSGSPLFVGSAGSGESEIRRWIIENDWLEAIIALPSDLFYYTGIAAYIWIITNHKNVQRRGKIQLINATDLYQPMRRNLGSKRKEIGPEQIEAIAQMFGNFIENDYAKIFPNEHFGYHRITVEQPLKLNFQASPERIENLKAEQTFNQVKEADKRALLNALQMLDSEHLYKDRKMFLRDINKFCQQVGLKLNAFLKNTIWRALGEKDETAEPCRNSRGDIEPDADLRDYENVPLAEDIYDYWQREVLPYSPEAWINESKTKLGYEINVGKAFSALSFDYDKDTVRIKSLLLPASSEVNVIFNQSKSAFVPFTKSEPSGYFSLALDTSQVDIDYLNYYLSSDEGQEWLQYHQKGVAKNYIPKEALLNAKIKLPPLEQQTKIASLFSKVEYLQEEIGNLSRLIWRDTDKSDELLDRYTNIEAKDENDYIYRLPYPLAVLLNHAVNEINDKDRCEAYLNFFECAGAVTLGAVIGELLSDERKFLKPRDGRSVTMGYYDAILKKIQEKGTNVKFRAAHSTFAQTKFIDVFAKAREVRNATAHSGIPNRKTVLDRLKRLTDLLEQFKLLTKDFFTEHQLLRPKSAKCLPDHFEFTIDLFSGLASTPFNKTIIKVREPLLDGTLYWGAVDSAVHADDFCQCYLASPLMKLWEVEEGLGIEDFYFFQSIEKGDTKANYSCPYWSMKESILIESDVGQFLSIHT